MGDQPQVDAELCADGLVPGHLAKRTLYTCDPIEGFEPELDRFGNVLEPDDPALYETAEGVVVNVHPLVLLTEHPELWATWSRWTSGLEHQLTWARYRSSSHLELQLWECLIATARRKRERERPPPGSANDDLEARRYMTWRQLHG